MLQTRAILFLTAILLIFTAFPALAQTQNFDVWLKNFRQEALQAGISQRTINVALNNIQSKNRVIELDRKQPEGKRTFQQYKKLIVDPVRIRNGKKNLHANYQLLQRVENQYGVPKQYIVALWGIETNYGANTGGFDIIPALATLAWEGRRGAFFKKELINALKIIDEGHISAANMKGSWAGAMGQCQFMPSSFNAYAVDGNGDGKRDIWNTKADIFASIANYLKTVGWKTNERWGRRVTLPASFPATLEGRKIKKPLSYWSSLGVKTYRGGALPQENMMASIVAPDGIKGETYIIYDNFRTIMDWNRSTYFATSVGLIADALAQ